MFSCNAEKELIGELKKQGYKYKGIDQIFKTKSLDPIEVNLILKWLPKIGKEHLGAGVILAQSLKSAKECFDPSILLKLFEESDLVPEVKSSIGFAIILAKTGDISNWIKKQLLNNDYAYERSALVNGLIKRGGFKNEDELKKFLELILKKYPIAVLEVYNKIGDKDDIDFLLEQMKIADKKLGKEIEKTLKKILKKEGVNKQ